MDKDEIVLERGPFGLIIPLTPAYLAAKAKAEKIAQFCRFNALVEQIEMLIDEVRTMPIAQRFSTEKKAWSLLGGPPGVPSAEFKDLTEAEYKRQQLILDLSRIRNGIMQFEGRLHDVIMDMEATKLD